MSEDAKRAAGFTVRWAALAAVAGAVATTVGLAAFGRAYASLPDRVFAVEIRVEKLEAELKAGRAERLQFQAEAKSELSAISAKLDLLLAAHGQDLFPKKP